jgi:hypothetical protein
MQARKVKYGRESGKKGAHEMDHLQHLQGSLENPERIAELNPKETLKKIGLGEHDGKPPA